MEYHKGPQWTASDLRCAPGETYSVKYADFQSVNGGCDKTSIHDLVKGLESITSDTNLDNYVKASRCQNIKDAEDCKITWLINSDYIPEHLRNAYCLHKHACICKHWIMHNLYVLHVPSKTLICVGNECINKFLTKENRPTNFCDGCGEPTGSARTIHGCMCESCRPDPRRRCPICNDLLGRKRRIQTCFRWDPDLNGKVICDSCESLAGRKAYTERQFCHGCRRDGKPALHPFRITMTQKLCKVCNKTFSLCPSHAWRDICGNHYKRTRHQ